MASSAPLHLREGGIKRKAVPSTVMEGSESIISPTNARSSAAMDMDRERSPPTPEVDDTPFIRFALDQLTRDEEVRGSRAYGGPKSGINQSHQYPGVSGTPFGPGQAREDLPQEGRTSTPEPATRVPPPRNPNRPISSGHTFANQPKQQAREPDIYLPLAADRTRPLNFRPGILRSFWLGLFVLVVLVYLILLLVAAILSITRTGLWDYGVFGDNRYFVFEYLPTLLGMILLLWLFQIQIAVTRMAPFLAMSSSTSKLRLAGPDLPIHTGGFLLPKTRYFGAGMPVLGFFMVIAWLQLFTIPLLASSFNAYFVGGPQTGAWRWIATQGVIWVVIALYILLLIAAVALIIYLARLEETGLKWDPRSLADLVVMLERSNALDEETEGRRDPARLGYWRTSLRPSEVFHAYGHANEEPRRYGVENGQIREKYVQRGSVETDLEANRPSTGANRRSKDAMLGGTGSDDARPAMAYPWFLRFSAALLWATIAFVLLLAFLIVSYLPSTRVAAGFLPALPTFVNRMGFGADNFLFSFIPALLAELCLLFWLDIDFAFRRYQPLFSLMRPGGDLAERSLLPSYSADLPGMVTAAAAANGHWRVAWLSFVSLIAAALPVLAGGVFWAQFSIPQQSVRIYAHMPGFYALTVLVTLYALSYLLILPLTAAQRNLAFHAPRNGHGFESFADVLALVRSSRILDDFAFHGPASKVGLVTRLMSVQPGTKIEGRPNITPHPEAATSKMSLADSVRGFGAARQNAIGAAHIHAVPKYGLARWSGRDGSEFWGIDRYR